MAHGEAERYVIDAFLDHSGNAQAGNDDLPDRRSDQGFHQRFSC
jgi:hypothetical protein